MRRSELPTLDDARRGADSVLADRPRAAREACGSCPNCAAVLSELLRYEATAADESTEPEAALVLSQVVARLRGIIEGSGRVEVPNPAPGQRWRSRYLEDVEAVVELVDAIDVHMRATVRGAVRFFKLPRDRFVSLMHRDGWTLRQAPSVAVEDEGQGIPATLRACAVSDAVVVGGTGGELREGSGGRSGSAVVVSRRETEQDAGDDGAEALGPAVGETLAVITGNEEA